MFPGQEQWPKQPKTTVYSGILVSSGAENRPPCANAENRPPGTNAENRPPGTDAELLDPLVEALREFDVDDFDQMVADYGQVDDTLEHLPQIDLDSPQHQQPALVLPGAIVEIEQEINFANLEDNPELADLGDNPFDDDIWRL